MLSVVLASQGFSMDLMGRLAGLNGGACAPCQASAPCQPVKACAPEPSCDTCNPCEARCDLFRGLRDLFACNRCGRVNCCCVKACEPACAPAACAAPAACEPACERPCRALRPIRCRPVCEKPCAPRRPALPPRLAKRKLAASAARFVPLRTRHRPWLDHQGCRPAVLLRPLRSGGLRLRLRRRLWRSGLRRWRRSGGSLGSGPDRGSRGPGQAGQRRGSSAAHRPDCRSLGFPDAAPRRLPGQPDRGPELSLHSIPALKAGSIATVRPGSPGRTFFCWRDEV